jgi:hypothetical protein
VVAAGLSLRNQDLRNLKVAATSFSIGGLYPPLADSFIKGKPVQETDPKERFTLQR